MQADAPRLTKEQRARLESRARKPGPTVIEAHPRTLMRYPSEKDERDAEDLRALLAAHDARGEALEAHVKAVGDFLNELYAIMVDPCAEGTVTVSEVKQALIDAALSQRQALADSAPPAGQGAGEPDEFDFPSALNFLTADLLRRFIQALARKLRHAETKYGHTDGWASDDWQTECVAALTAHVRKGDPLDVAAYAAFCWHHGWSTAPAQPDATTLADEARARSDRLAAARLAMSEPIAPLVELQAHLAQIAKNQRSNLEWCESFERDNPWSNHTNHAPLKKSIADHERWAKALATALYLRRSRLGARACSW